MTNATGVSKKHRIYLYLCLLFASLAGLLGWIRVLRPVRSSGEGMAGVVWRELLRRHGLARSAHLPRGSGRPCDPAWTGRGGFLPEVLLRQLRVAPRSEPARVGEGPDRIADRPQDRGGHRA